MENKFVFVVVDDSNGGILGIFDSEAKAQKSIKDMSLHDAPEGNFRIERWDVE